MYPQLSGDGMARERRMVPLLTDYPLVPLNLLQLFATQSDAPAKRTNCIVPRPAMNVMECVQTDHYLLWILIQRTNQ